MSSLAQVHVTYLSRRCLPSPIWRHNARNKFILDRVTVSKIPTQGMIELSPSAKTELVVPRRALKSHKLIRIEKTNTPSLSRLRKLVDVDIGYKESNILPASYLMDPIRTIPLSRIWDCDTAAAYGTQITSAIRLSSRYKTDQIVSSCPFTTETISRAYRERGRDRSYREAGPQFGARELGTALAAFGIFTNLNQEDIEQERKKLSDEQKVKKMSNLELLTAKGVLSLCDQEYDKAKTLFHKALHLAQDEANEEQETLILNLLAAAYFDSGQFEEAEKLFIDLIKRLIAKGVQPTDSSVLELSLKLSCIYGQNIKTHTKALKGFGFIISSLMHRLKDTLDILEEVDVDQLSDKVRNDLALLGWSYDWLSKQLIAMNDFNEAVEILQKALEISTKILGPLHDQTLILLNDVGTTMAMNNSPEEGKTFITKAVEGALESKSKELASFYVNLGLVNLQLRKLSEAKRYCEYSIELALKNQDNHNTSEVVKLSRSCLDEIKILLETNAH